MALTASIADKQAYAKLGGAMDSIAEGYTYAAKFLSTVDAARDPLRNSGRTPKVLKATGIAQKAYIYFRKIQEVLDEKARDGGLFKLGMKLSIDLAGKVLGVSLTTHPYYVYHKIHFEVLATVLNAHSNHKAAIEAYRTAISAADSAAVAAEFKRLESRKVDIVASRWQFSDTAGIAADIARGMMTDDLARKKIEQYGAAKLGQAIADLETWRANWAGLAFDCMQLQIMAGNELKVATEAMQKVQDLMATMMRGGSTGRVAGYGALKAIEWEKYDKIVGQNKSARLMMDPVKFAQGNLDKATALAEVLTEMCDFVRTEQVLFLNKFREHLERLNRVLYG